MEGHKRSYDNTRCEDNGERQELEIGVVVVVGGGGAPLGLLCLSQSNSFGTGTLEFNWKFI